MNFDLDILARILLACFGVIWCVGLVIQLAKETSVRWVTTLLLVTVGVGWAVIHLAMLR